MKFLLNWLFLMLFCTLANASVETVAQKFAQKYPEMQLTQLAETPIKGLYSANLEGRVVYVSEDAAYIMAGGVMIRLQDQHNLTQDLALAQNKIDWQKLPLADAIKTVQGNGKRQLVVFSDPNCPYCKRLEAELAQLQDVTIYTFIYAVHTRSIAPAQALWCAKDRNQAWHDYISAEKQPKAAQCDNPILRNIALAQQLGISGTPTLVLANGFKLQGFYSQQEIQEIWQDLGL